MVAAVEAAVEVVEDSVVEAGLLLHEVQVECLWEVHDNLQDLEATLEVDQEEVVQLQPHLLEQEWLVLNLLKEECSEED